MAEYVGFDVSKEDRILLKARVHLVRRRRDTENVMRGLLASLGLRFPKGKAKLGVRVRAALEERPALRPAIEPLLSIVAALRREIERLDKAVMARRTSHKKACVALARKLAVILHRMLITGEAFRWPEKDAAA